MVEMHAESFVSIASLWILCILKISLLEVSRSALALSPYSQTLRHWGLRFEALINCSTTYPIIEMNAESFVSIASV